jgi:thiosulfate/3-mercaptopyruvate sulfurtransferase
MNRRGTWPMVLTVTAIFLLLGAARIGAGQDALAGARKIEPLELVKKLALPPAERPVILQVGFKTLYNGAHIPGAIYAGPASTSVGMAHLKQRAQAISRGKEVVIYCGCCPLEQCPNVRPAYAALREMGFKNLEVLDLPQDFVHDWVEKNLPIVRGH